MILSTNELDDLAKKVADKIIERLQGTIKPQKKWLTTKEAAAVLGITVEHLRRPKTRAKYRHFVEENGRIVFNADDLEPKPKGT